MGRANVDYKDTWLSILLFTYDDSVYFDDIINQMDPNQTIQCKWENGTLFKKKIRNYYYWSIFFTWTFFLSCLAVLLNNFFLINTGH